MIHGPKYSHWIRGFVILVTNRSTCIQINRAIFKCGEMGNWLEVKISLIGYIQSDSNWKIKRIWRILFDNYELLYSLYQHLLSNIYHHLPFELGFNPVMIVLSFSSIRDTLGLTERDTILKCWAYITNDTQYCQLSVKMSNNT